MTCVAIGRICTMHAMRPNNYCCVKVLRGDSTDQVREAQKLKPRLHHTGPQTQTVSTSHWRWRGSSRWASRHRSRSAWTTQTVVLRRRPSARSTTPTFSSTRLEFTHASPTGPPQNRQHAVPGSLTHLLRDQGQYVGLSCNPEPESQGQHFGLGFGIGAS